MKDRRDRALLLCATEIICLQETHWDERCVDDVKKGWMGDVYVNNGGLNARGVAILIRTGVVENVRKVEDDGEGRMIGVEFDYMGEMFKLINVHAPNEEKERKVFFEGLDGKCGGNCMVVGDFNVWCGKIDVAGGMRFKNDASRRALEKMMGENGLRDLWRERNRDERVYTRKQVVGGVLKQSRIDLVLCKRSMGSKIGEFKHGINSLSDHVILRFSMGDGHRGKGGGVWCLNASLLKDESYKGMVHEWINKQGSMDGEDEGEWWEDLKGKIKKMSIKFSHRKNKKGREKEGKLKEALVRELERIEGEIGRDLGVYNRLMDELGVIEREKCMGAIVRSRARYLVEGEKCTGFFLGMEKRKQGNNYIKQIEGEEGEVISDLVGIVKRVGDFYEDLFKKEGIDKECLEKALDSMEAVLTEEGKAMCEGEITKEEIEAAIDGMGKNKSPGLDGLTAEFYHEFKGTLSPILCKLFKCFEERDELPDGLSTGVISILFKKGSRDKLGNYRPLSMLNNDYKVLARVLSNRMKRVIGVVVGSTQAYSIPGRDISDTICSIRDIISYMKGGIGGVVMSLDLNKAFDRVNHEYLFKVLEKAGFGSGFTGWIRRIYRKAMSCVKVNGIVTNVFKLGRSVRQGCPLSAMLYALSAEPLAALLKKNEKVEGVVVPGGEVSVVYQYADDTTITVRDMESVKGVFESVEVYGRASGAKINIEKSEFMVLGTGSVGRAEVELKENKDFFRVLGINLGLKDREGRDVQYEGVLGSIRKTLRFWKLRKLKLRGKVVVVNGLIMSKLVYIMSVLDVPERVVREINKIVSEFIWDGRGIRIAREVLENEYKDGGLKLINIGRKVKTMRVKTMIKYLNKKDDHVWKAFLRDSIDKGGGCGDSGIFMCYKKGWMSGMSEFQEEVMSAWGEFLVNVRYSCVSKEQVWGQPIFQNKMIMKEGEVMFNLAMWRAGFRVVRDLVYEYVPGFMRAQVIIDGVRGEDLLMGKGTAETLLEDIKEGMPGEWKRMIESENVGSVESDVELYVGEGVKLGDLSAKGIYKMFGGGSVRRPASEKVWEKVMGGMDVRKIWWNLSVKGNSIECEQFDFLLRHNRVFNNLIISMFDKKVKRECDVCRVEVENCMHEFFECRELKGFFWELKEMICRCWDIKVLRCLEWKELWLFGMNGKMDGYNVGLLNMCLSQARYAVKIRRNAAHYEGRIDRVWNIMKRNIKRDLGMLLIHKGKDVFEVEYVEGSGLIQVDDGKITYHFDE